MDIFDQAQQLNELYQEVTLKNQLRKAAEPVDGETEHGICIDCKEKINPKRLEANPQAIRCIVCQTAKERRNGNNDA